jgi:hypothetical protein
MRTRTFLTIAALAAAGPVAGPAAASALSGSASAQVEAPSDSAGLDSAGFVSSRPDWSELDLDEPRGFLASLPSWLLPLGLVLLFLGIGAAATAFVYRRRVATALPPRQRQSDDEEWPLPPLIVPARTAPAPPATTRADTASVPDAAAGAARPQPQPQPQRYAPTQEAQGTAPAPAALRTATTPQPLVPEHGEEVNAGPIRFHRPPEGTLQLLPGRLEIESGAEQHDEIRFVKIAGRDPVVTFGRSRGEPHTHVELRSPTVSRQHAVLRYLQGQWHIENLSRTNPVLINGRSLPAGGAARSALADGDRVEMGEVVFRFRWR